MRRLSVGLMQLRLSGRLKLTQAIRSSTRVLTTSAAASLMRSILSLSAPGRH